MIRVALARRAAQWSIHGSMLALLLATPAFAQNDASEPLARYIPAEGLAILVEHGGFDAHPDAWKGTAAYKMLHETSLGAMLEDIASQVAEYGFRAARGAPITGKELIGLLAHLAEKGFAVGYSPDLQGREPKALVVVIRDAADNEVFKRVLSRIPQLNQPAVRQVQEPGGRNFWVAEDARMRWWYEKNDFVFLFASDKDANPAVDALEGKVSSALKHSTYAALEKLEAGQVPVGRLFVDLVALPPLPPRAGELGLDGIRRIESRWGIQDKGVVITLGVHAPRPRRGILALFDQPPIQAGTGVVTPKGVADYTLVSVDPIKLADGVLALIRQDNPDAAGRIDRFAERFRDRTGLSLRDDLLAKVGPRMAVLVPAGKGVSSVFSMWFSPPDFALVAEVKDARDFAATLDRLMEAANRELSTAGALVPRQPGQPSKPGTEFAEFRRLKAPEQGYVLAVPPAVLPTPAGLRPTVIFEPDRGLLVVAGSPATARHALSSLVLNDPAAEPAWGRDAVVFAQSDPSGSLPELLASLPSLVQFIGFSATQQPGPPRAPGMAGPSRRPPFRLQLDPDTIPDVEQLRQYLFPSRFTLAVDDASIRWSAYQAFPLPAPSINAGMETPVLIALLLPAVQPAREAARRAQCVNNLKQIALAFGNYHSAQRGFPAAAIVDQRGKPLLSWRVAILPYLDQQALYDKFKLDEPWNSHHNKELLKYMPTFYSCPSRNSAGGPGLTTYRAFAGKDTLLDATRLTRLAQVTDGTSNTIMVVEAKEAVPWTKPDELPFDNAPGFRAAPLFGAGSAHPGGFNAALGDGSVRFIKSSINPQTLRALITKSGGEIVSSDSY